MTLIQLHEQLSDGTYLPSEDAKAIVPYVDDGKEVVYTVRRGREDKVCLSLRRTGDDIVACGSYFVGIDWVEQCKVAVQVNPKINDDFEVDYVRMLNDALSEPANYDHLQHLVTIHFNKPSIKVHQQRDVLSKESRILSPIQISIIASVLRPNVPNTPIFSVDQPPN